MKDYLKFLRKEVFQKQFLAVYIVLVLFAVTNNWADPMYFFFLFLMSAFCIMQHWDFFKERERQRLLVNPDSAFER